jgi:hypothetical protein
MKYSFFLCVVLGSFTLLSQCSKKDAGGNTVNPTVNKQRLNYGDSVFVVKEDDYSILPKAGGEDGSYYAVPNNLEIDKKTGRITITAKDTSGTSLAGLWYKIFFHSAVTDRKDSTMILLEGINYVDAFLYSNQGNAVISPILNGDPSATLPASKYLFEIKGKKFKSTNSTGKINLADFMRTEAEELARRNYVETEITYTLKGGKPRNEKVDHKLNLVIYKYPVLDSVPSNVSQLMQTHQQMTFGYSTPAIQSTAGRMATDLPQYLAPERGALLKPRPPCIVIIGH